MLNKYSGRGETFKLLFGKATGEVLSRVQGTVVSSGSGLQSLIRGAAASVGAAVEFQARVKDPTTGKTHRADILILDANPVAIELKLGYQFDTKKSTQEVLSICEFSHFRSLHDGKRVGAAICLFLASSHEQMGAGFKASLPDGVVLMTGPELCARLGISYETVLGGYARARAAMRSELVQLLDDAMKVDDTSDFSQTCEGGATCP